MEITVTLKALQKGEYYRLSEIEEKFPELGKEWLDWLDKHLDPGNYDTYKIRDSSILPYIDGKPQWVTDAFMPAFLVQKLAKLLQD